MASVNPLRGILFNPLKINSLEAVTAPPYDVISPAEQGALADKHPHNVIRLILDRARETDTEQNNPHTRSAAYFRQWMTQGILKQDDAAALYLTATTYTHAARTFTRHGLIARVGLEPFEKRVILPHEQTFSKVRSERLALIKATHCNFCPIFCLYPDDGGLLNTLQQAVAPTPTSMDFQDDQGHRHRLWRILDPTIHRDVTTAMKARPLYIADGHHRYETALNFRRHLQTTDPSFGDRHPANDVLMYLCSMSDPGLLILPAHRLLKTVAAADIRRALEQSRAYFDMVAYPFTVGNRPEMEQRFLSDCDKDSDRTCIGIYAHRHPVFHRLTLKSGVIDRLFAQALPASLRTLDVTVLTRVMFMNILGLHPAQMDNHQFIGYVSAADQALQSIDRGDYDAAFILNPTRIEQVRGVADQGLTMPRKSTYFYPKVRSGLVMHSLEQTLGRL